MSITNLAQITGSKKGIQFVKSFLKLLLFNQETVYKCTHRFVLKSPNRWRKGEGGVKDYSCSVVADSVSG